MNSYTELFICTVTIPKCRTLLTTRDTLEEHIPFLSSWWINPEFSKPFSVIFHANWSRNGFTRRKSTNTQISPDIRRFRQAIPDSHFRRSDWFTACDIFVSRDKIIFPFPLLHYYFRSFSPSRNTLLCLFCWKGWAILSGQKNLFK